MICGGVLSYIQSSWIWAYMVIWEVETINIVSVT